MKFKITRRDQDIIASVMVFKEKWWLWVINMKNALRYGVPIVLGVTLMISYMLFQKPQSSQDFIVADQAYDQWVKGADEKLVDLERLMHEHPELHAKYDGAIAAHLIAMDKGLQAADYASKTWDRTTGIAQYHEMFAKTSMSISGGNYDVALHEAQRLKADLDMSDMQNCKVLYGYNLLRVAALEKQLGHSDKEQEAFQQLVAFLDANKNDQELQPLITHFRAGSVDLTDYIEYRQKG